MPLGPLGGPRPLANEKKVFLTFRIGRGQVDSYGQLKPTELEIQKTIAEIRGPGVDDIDIQIETLDDGDVLASDELHKGMEISSQQMQRVASSIEDELDVNVKSNFIQVT